MGNLRDIEPLILAQISSRFFQDGGIPRDLR